MDFSFFIYLSSGLFLGWSLGANDACNIFGTAIGSKMIKFKNACIISSIFIVFGAVYAGEGASHTLNELGSVNALAGSFMVALSAALTVYWMTTAGISVSTSQAIVGAIIGWNFFAGKDTDFSILSKIFSTWVICPVLSACFAILLYLLFKFVLKRSKLHILRQDMYTRIGLIMFGAFGAYALGANNIANIMGVFVDTSPLQALTIGSFTVFNSVQVLFFIGALSIAFGVFTYSHRVIKTIGNSIMVLSPVNALIVVMAQGFVLFLFSSQALQHLLLSYNLPTIPLVPVSSSQAVIGAIMGIGLIKGGSELKWAVLGKIGLGWVLTPICSAICCFVALFFLENVFGLVVYN